MKLFEDITYTDEELQPIINFCEVNQEFSPVVTKFNKDNQWTAISLRGYGSETTQIGKGGVLGTDVDDGLQNTILYDALVHHTILYFVDHHLHLFLKHHPYQFELSHFRNL